MRLKAHPTTIVYQPIRLQRAVVDLTEYLSIAAISLVLRQLSIKTVTKRQSFAKTTCLSISERVKLVLPSRPVVQAIVNVKTPSTGIDIQATAQTNAANDAMLVATILPSRVQSIH